MTEGNPIPRRGKKPRTPPRLKTDVATKITTTLTYITLGESTPNPQTTLGCRYLSGEEEGSSLEELAERRCLLSATVKIRFLITSTIACEVKRKC